MLLGLVILGGAMLLLGIRSERRVGTHEAVVRYMADTYGEPDAKKERFGAPAEGEAPFVRLCAERPVEVKGVPHVLVAACEVDGSQGTDELPIGIDLIVLRLDSTGRAIVAAKQDPVQQGGGDTRLQGVDVVQLGPNFFGFRIESVYFARGFDISNATLYAPHDQAFAAVLTLTLHGDNNGSDCGTANSSPCFSFDRRLEIEAASHDEFVYPIRVTESRPNGAPRNAVFRFDHKRWQYVGPVGFEPNPPL